MASPFRVPLLSQVHPRNANRRCRRARDAGTRHALALPLTVGGAVVAVLR